jgi:glucokinase
MHGSGIAIGSTTGIGVGEVVRENEVIQSVQVETEARS